MDGKIAHRPKGPADGLFTANSGPAKGGFAAAGAAARRGDEQTKFRELLGNNQPSGINPQGPSPRQPKKDSAAALAGKASPLPEHQRAPAKTKAKASSLAARADHREGRLGRDSKSASPRPRLASSEAAGSLPGWGGLLKNSQSEGSQPTALAFMAGESVQAPLSPPELVGLATTNPFISEALAGDTGELLGARMPVADLMALLTGDNALAAQGAALGLNPGEVVSVGQFLQGVGIDPGQVSAQLERLKTMLLGNGLKDGGELAGGGDALTHSLQDEGDAALSSAELQTLKSKAKLRGDATGLEAWLAAAQNPMLAPAPIALASLTSASLTAEQEASTLAGQPLKAASYLDLVQEAAAFEAAKLDILDSASGALHGASNEAGELSWEGFDLEAAFMPKGGQGAGPQLESLGSFETFAGSRGEASGGRGLLNLDGIDLQGEVVLSSQSGVGVGGEEGLLTGSLSIAAMDQNGRGFVETLTTASQPWRSPFAQGASLSQLGRDAAIQIQTEEEAAEGRALLATGLGKSAVLANVGAAGLPQQLRRGNELKFMQAYGRPDSEALNDKSMFAPLLPERVEDEAKPQLRNQERSPFFSDAPLVLNGGDVPEVAAGAALAPSSAAVDGKAQAALVEQIRDHSQLMLKQGGGSAVIKVNDKDLGELSLAINVQGGKVRLKMLSPSEEVRSLLGNDLPQLKEALAAQNLQLMDVDIGQDRPRDSEAPMQQFAFAGQQGQASREEGRSPFDPGGNHIKKAEAALSGVAAASAAPTESVSNLNRHIQVMI